MTILPLSDDPSLHNTCAITISNLNGSKMAADIVRRQEGASSAASSRKTLRLTWQCERHAVPPMLQCSKSSPFNNNRYRRDLPRDANRMPWQWNVAGSMYIPNTLSLHNALGYRHPHARLLSRTSFVLGDRYMTAR